jgi:hypothetical protein
LFRLTVAFAEDRKAVTEKYQAFAASRLKRPGNWRKYYQKKIPIGLDADGKAPIWAALALTTTEC